MHENMKHVPRRRPDRLFAFLTVIVLLLMVLAGCSDDREDAWQYVLAWEDEFEGPAGQLPDAANWRFDIGTNWGNDQLECDTNRPENVSLDGNGNLAITAREEAYQTCDYTSGRIKTQGLFEQAGGKFEASIKLPIGQGIWPAFWLLGADIGSVGWPECGEIDIMEYRGQSPSIVSGAVHGPGYSGGGALYRQYAIGGSFNDDFHVFGVEWTEDRIAWYVDDKEYFTLTKSSVTARGKWVFDHKFFIILNVAVGGNYVGPPDDTTVFPQTMLIDWVRVYKPDR
jgi:beta-glucanase (GH16 family)